MARMIATAKCYLNDRLYEEGEEFDTELPEGRAFHPVDKPAKDHETYDARITKAAQKKYAEDQKKK